MKFSKVSVFCILCLWIESCLCKFYMTSYELNKLIQSERDAINSLNGYITRQENRGLSFEPSVKQFLEYADQANNATSDTRPPDNPLSAFYLVYRAVVEWKRFAENVSCDEAGEEKCPILTGYDVIKAAKKRSKVAWPDETDLKYAGVAIINVWLTYDLDLDQVINGDLGNVTEQSMTGDQIYYVANAARDAGRTFEAITWFEYLLDRLDKYNDVVMFKESTLYRRLSMTYNEFGMLSIAKEVLKRASILHPDDKGVSRDIEFLSWGSDSKRAVELARFQPNDTSRTTKLRLEYEELCRSTANGELHYNRNLSCLLVPLFNCYGNVKVELVSKNPRIEIIHDVLLGNETESVISYADYAFQRPRLEDGQQKLIGSSMCEYNPRVPLMKKLTKRLARMTRFNMYQYRGVSSSQCYELINEGTGIISNPETDYWPHGHQPFPYAGNRVATIYAQLSDVQYGGAIVFPKVNITVPLQKGSAVVWWNLKRNGKPNPKAAYQNCPVLQGNQWGLVKRILYANQAFARNCDK